jgi:glutathione synthase/RimK-type ligase-like ATP-grasp enzyme
MLLIISSKADDTVDYFLNKTAFCKELYFRLNTEDLHIKSSITVDYQFDSIQHLFDGNSIEYSMVKAVWYRRPEPINIKNYLDIDQYEAEFIRRENEKLWGGILDSLTSVIWVNHPQANIRANYKPEQLFRAKRFGLNIPHTIITDSKHNASEFIKLNGTVIVKPISFGYIQRELPEHDSIIYTNVLHAPSERLLESIEHNPTLIQQFIDKIIDIRVNYINKKLFAFAIHSQEKEDNKVDFRRNNSAGLKYSEFELPNHIGMKLKALLDSYELQFAAVDMVLDKEGGFFFLEINPNGQWAWLEEETGIKLSEELFRSFRIS